METKGLFDLTAFESANANEEVNVNILDQPIVESEAEFDTKSPASPTEHFDADCSGDKKVTADPAEKPTAKPADGEMGPVNANSQAEAPTAKPYDAASISIPAGVVLTASEYNDALKRLQQSFKEAAELTEALQHVTVVEESVDDLQEQFTEAAIIASLEDGPIFERVKRDDKDEIKEITRKLRDEGVAKFFKNNSASGTFYKPAVIRKFFETFFNHRMWQIVGCALIEGEINKTGTLTDQKTANEVCKVASEKFSDTLGDFKLIPYAVNKSIFDLFRTHFHIKDDRWPFFILVDKKVDAKIKDELK